MKINAYALVIIWMLGPPMNHLAWAEESDLGEKPQAAAPEKPAPLKSRGKRKSDQDAEGTKAPDRFEADTVIKSNYKRGGQPLEVDPD